MRISENGVSFSGSGGHNHNGVNSSIIDVGSYSLFDFSLGYKGSQSRINAQGTNQGALEDWVIRIVNSKVLQPAGLTLDPNSLSGKSIRSNTITATELQANTITADEIAANTITANELSSNIVLINNVIRSNNYDGTIAANGVITSQGSAGWAITHAGSAEFSSASIRGAITANSVSTPGVDILSDGSISSTNFNVTATGNITAVNANITGAISASTISGSTISGTTLTTNDGTNGIEITSDGYIRGTGGDGVRIKNSDGTTAGTQLFKNLVKSDTITGSVLSVTSYFDARSTGVTISPLDGNRPLDLQRNFVTDAHFIRFYKTSGTPGESGKIRFAAANGLVVAYDTTSDERLKTNIVKIKNATDTIKIIEPVEYSFIEDSEGTSHGFIAQDLYKVYDKPVYVGGEDPREDPWSIDYSKMVPIITAALKESIAKIEELEVRIQALEGV